MQHSYLPRQFNAFAATAIAAFGLMLSTGAALAQTTKTVKGDFRSSDGNSGTYVATIAVNGEVTTETVVYTRSSDQETSTDITTTTKDPADKSRTISYSHTDYGSTAEFTSNKTIAKVKGGFSGSGTYTTAAGTTGTLTSLESSASGVSAKTTTYTSSAGKVTTNLRLEEDALDLGIVAIKVLALNPDGTTTATVTTRYITSVD